MIPENLVEATGEMEFIERKAVEVARPVSWQALVFMGKRTIARREPIFRGALFGRPLTLSGAGEDCFRGLFLEVSLALVGVASPA
jgi:hypothetical protein